jgi:hypothetical protein
LPWVFIRKPGTPVNSQAPYLSGSRGALHTFKESCNKILHATLVEVTEAEGENLAAALEPRVKLFGEQGKREWKAVLDIRQFVVAAVVVR